MKIGHYFFYLASIFYMPLQAQIKYTSVKTGLGTITDITHAGDGSNRIFVANKTGTISILDQNYNTLGTLLSMTGMLNLASEMGLLGLAFHPQYSTNGYFYVNYNPSGTRTNRISRFTATTPSTNTTVNLTSEKIIIEITGAANNNHKAGDLAFGPDGYLYITTGDGGGGGDPQGSGQNGNTLLGKILRLDVNTALAYIIPATNPYLSNASILDEIWDIGLRNPWRISFDRSNGDLWIADVGQNAREEINVEANGAGGNNYGWNCREGFGGYSGSCQNNPGFKDPIFDYSRCGTPCLVGTGNSITGGFVYRGTTVTANAALRGYYIFADYVSKHAWIIKNTGTSGLRSVLEVKLIANFTSDGITSFGEIENGEILAGQSNGNLGTIIATRALPVKLNEFTVLLNKSTAVLHWQTSSEFKTLRYDIEKSKNGIDFGFIGSVPATNKSQGDQYQYLDPIPFRGENYYRIKIVDQDDQTDYTRIVKLHYLSSDEFYYSAATNQVRFVGPGAYSSKVLNIISVNGSIVKNITVNSDLVTLADMPAGIYIIQSKIEGVYLTKKVFVL